VKRLAREFNIPVVVLAVACGCASPEYIQRMQDEGKLAWESGAVMVDSGALLRAGVGRSR